MLTIPRFDVHQDHLDLALHLQFEKEITRITWSISSSFTEQLKNSLIFALSMSQEKPLNETLREEFQTDPMTYLNDIEEKITKVVIALQSPKLSAIQKQTVQRHKESLTRHTRTALRSLKGLLST
ncbi:MAG: hypothetical protein ACRDF4_10635 [Rhabdochlamydiaceae bacterium]